MNSTELDKQSDVQSRHARFSAIATRNSYTPAPCNRALTIMALERNSIAMLFDRTSARLPDGLRAPVTMWIFDKALFAKSTCETGSSNTCRAGAPLLKIAGSRRLRLGSRRLQSGTSIGGLSQGGWLSAFSQVSSFRSDRSFWQSCLPLQSERISWSPVWQRLSPIPLPSRQSTTPHIGPDRFSSPCSAAPIHLQVKPLRAC